MPRVDHLRITSRQPIDSSKSANIPLEVRASQDDVRGAGSAMWGVADALNGLARAGTYIARERQNQKDKQDTTDGTAAAAQRAVTGESPSLEGMSKAYVRAYQQTDGLRLADDFGKSIAPELAKLEPGADVDRFIQDKASEFVSRSDMKEEARKSFMVSVARAQTGWKDQHMRRSITESMKREEENLGALATSGIRDGSLLTPDGLKGFHQTLGSRGLSDTEANEVIAQAFVASMASGEAEPQKAMEVLKTPLGDDGVSISDIPAFKAQFDAASKRGQSVIDSRQQKAQAGELTHVYERLYDKADQGILSDHEIDAVREKYNRTPEWAASMHNRNREAQQRFAHQQQKDVDAAHLVATGMSGDPAAIAMAGRDKVGAAMSKMFAKAYAAGDNVHLLRILSAITAANAPLPVLGDYFAQFDPSDVKRAQEIINLRNMLEAQSSTYAGQYIPPKVAAMMHRYDSETQVMGLSPAQALQKIAQTQPILDNGATRALVAKAIKDNHSLIPTDFDDNPFYKSDTPIANQAYVDARVKDIAAEMVATGQVSPKDAVQHAVARFKATNVRVGDMYIPVPNGTPREVGTAFTELGKDWKDRLVKDGKVDEDAMVFWLPAVNDPSKWVLMRNDDGVSRAVVTKDKSGTPDFVELSAEQVMLKYHHWSADKARKEIEWKQGLRQLALPNWSHEEASEKAKAIATGSDLPKEQGWVKDRYEDLNKLLKSTETLSFIDYLYTTQ